MLDNINWEYVIGIGGILATIFTAGVGVRYFLLIPKLKYFIEILPFINPSNIDKKINGNLKIIYDNNEVKKLNVATVKIFNTGKNVAENFSAPIKIDFNSKILSAYPNEEAYELGIISDYSISDNEIKFKPNFINSKEHVTFTVVVSELEESQIKVSGRCKGCSQIKKIKSRKYLQGIYGFILGACLPILFMCYVHYKSNSLEKICLSLKEINDNIEKQIVEIEQRNKKVEDKMEKTNKGVLFCKKAEEICSLCKYGVTLAIAKNVSLSETEKIDLISKIDKFSSDMEMLNIKDESTPRSK